MAEKTIKEIIEEKKVKAEKAKPEVKEKLKKTEPPPELENKSFTTDPALDALLEEKKELEEKIKRAERKKLQEEKTKRDELLKKGSDNLSTNDLFDLLIDRVKDDRSEVIIKQAKTEYNELDKRIGSSKARMAVGQLLKDVVESKILAARGISKIPKAK